ncbi:molybdenum cofactor sulfurase [Mollisia scopiformis]|uniref:Molybdenum cofactor sulfurase n=1 Tax=Mollisia scopiformis TaxID=149040 RepID=A0A194XQA3_MOLSC|nr:molybdenum cofactor sulfurase [Mollisia scopiformis]KUJ22341.1 molybdenum cofactor sulfurase [Mollisia scopiformis]
MEDGYNSNVEAFREAEYPMLQDAIYLDHAGTTLYAKSLMEKFTSDMISNLYGNPHSASASSQLTTNRIEDIRLKVLRCFNADPEEFDIIFVANATAGIKLVMECFRELEGGYNYGYHKDSHTSLVGVRESASSSRCLDDEDVEQWLSGASGLVGEGASSDISLFAYPAQSNMDGRRLPLSWSERVRANNSNGRVSYTLLDASAFVSTSALDLSDASTAPDFTVLSFYKIFGFPDLGALIVRKESGTILQRRKYFGGGTVDVVLCMREQWHAPKSQSFHDRLEDGTLAIHNILALNTALEVHRELYGSMEKIARHTSFLARKLFDGLSSLRHENGELVCVIHSSRSSTQHFSEFQGPVVAFNLKNSYGAWISNTEFERLASVRNFHIRSGGLCNPGGVAACLQLEPWEMRNNFSAGYRCGAETDIYAGKITGVIRASLGAMSTISDVDSFISFIREFYVETATQDVDEHPPTIPNPAGLFVESLTIYPIKSCGGFTIASNVDWEVRPEGLVWDREWCLVHQGTGQALSQKRHPLMALIRPSLDFRRGMLCIQFYDPKGNLPLQELAIPLSANPSFYTTGDGGKSSPSRVCGDAIVAQTYSKPEITAFFSNILGVPCTLARFPAGGSGFSTRHSKAHMQKHQRPKRHSSDEVHVPGAFAPPTPPDSDNENRKRPILLSNESPILAINKDSLDVLNDGIIRSGGKPASASVFRANIVLASSQLSNPQPYAEDHWSSLRIGQQNFQMLGSCRRCHMICVDQDTAEKNEEPFVTLAKTRRFESKIFFGSHMCHIPSKIATKESQYPTIRVGDIVRIGTTEET